LRARMMRRPQHAQADDESRRQDFEKNSETEFHDFEFHGLFVPIQELSLWFSQQPKGCKSIDDRQRRP